MRLKHFSTWGCFYPMTSGADLVVANQLEYFRARDWNIDCVIAKRKPKDRHFEAFCDRYSWVNTITPVEVPWSPFTFRDTLFAYEQACRLPKMRDALAAPADLFLTNYVFTSPLTQHLPPGCKRILETVDVMARQFACVERTICNPKPGDQGSVAVARDNYLLKVERDLYQLFDAAIIINRNEHDLMQANGINHSYYVPQIAPTRAPVASGRRSRYDYDLIFVASDAAINVSGMDWFYRNVYVPHLWRHGVRLLIVGSVCDYLRFRDANVTLMRQIDDALDPLYEATKLAVIPIFEGTGLSIKTLEGLAQGRALVVTPSGARGLEDAGDAFVMIDMKAEAGRTADVILDLLASPDKRQALERAAVAYVNRHFTRDGYFAAMDRVIAGVGLDPLAAARSGEPAASAA